MTEITSGRLPDESEQQLKLQALNAGIEARRNMIEKHPFLGSLAMHMKLVPTVDCRMNSAATDGKTVFLDANYFLMLPPEERMSIIAHEVWHCAMRHMLRKEDRDHKRFNYACDIETDLLLKRDGFVVDLLPYEDSWEGQAAEWIYEQIPAFLARFETKDMHVYPNRSIPGTLPPDHAEQQDTQADGAEQMEAEHENGTFMKPQLPPVTNSQVYDPDFSMDFPADLEESWKENLYSAAKHCKEHGTLPAHFQTLIHESEKQPLDWKKTLLDFVTMLIGGERQWVPPNRRFLHKKLYLPSRARKPSMDLVVAIDTSGSVQEFLGDFMTELSGIASSFGDYRITLILCDAKIQKVTEYTNDNPPPDKTFHVYGLGGTDFRPPFKYVMDNFVEMPMAMIYLTDGLGPAPAHEPPFPVIWCLAPDCEKPANWGIEIVINEDDNTTL